MAGAVVRGNRREIDVEDRSAVIEWGARISPGKIRRLYESHARGLLDEGLLDEVAYGLLARCESILAVKEAKRGRVKCPGCGRLVLREGRGKEARFRCGGCRWQATWFDYRKSFLRRQLNHGGASDVFEGYVRRMPACRSAEARMRLVDWLLHECHKSLRASDGQPYWTRPVAPNLIRGTMTELAALLDDLAYGPTGTPETKKAQREWRRKLSEGRAEMMQEHRG